MFGLDEVSQNLQSAVATTNNSERLPTAIYSSISGWLGDKIWPLIMGTAVLATLLFAFYGAFLYFTAYGDENRATNAKKSITYAIIGFIIALLAFSIMNYVQNIIISRQAQTELTAPTNNQTP